MAKMLYGRSGSSLGMGFWPTGSLLNCLQASRYSSHVPLWEPLNGHFFMVTAEQGSHHSQHSFCNPKVLKVGPGGLRFSFMFECWNQPEDFWQSHMQLYKGNLRQQGKKKKRRQQGSQGHRKKGMATHPWEKAERESKRASALSKTKD